MEEKCELQECPDYFPEEIVAPELPSDEGGGGGGGGSVTLHDIKAASSSNEAYSTKYINNTIDGINHDIKNLTDLMPAVLQVTGDSESDVMSQKAVTEIVGNINTLLETLISGTGASA